MVLPGHVAEIVEHRQVGAGGDVGQADVLPGQPVALLEQVADVGEMGVQVGDADPHRGGVRRLAVGDEFEHLLAPDQVGHLAQELLIEPRHQAPHLGPIDRIHAEQPPLRPGLLQIFADHGAVDDRPVMIEQHGHLGRRIERGHLLALPPGLDRLEARLQLLFAQQDAHLARERIEREMEQAQHGYCLTNPSHCRQALKSGCRKNVCAHARRRRRGLGRRARLQAALGVVTRSPAAESRIGLAGRDLHPPHPARGLGPHVWRNQAIETARSLGFVRFSRAAPTLPDAGVCMPEHPSTDIGMISKTTRDPSDHKPPVMRSSRRLCGHGAASLRTRASGADRSSALLRALTAH